MTRVFGSIAKTSLGLAMLIMLCFLVSCFRAPAPDDDLLSGILLGDFAAVQQALDRGANAGRVYEDGTTPLMHACKEFKNIHGEAGAEVNVSLKADLTNSETSLDAQVRDAHASRSTRTVQGNPEIVRLLLARGADVNARDREGRTALALALQNDMPEIAEILRQTGAKE